MSDIDTTTGTDMGEGGSPRVAQAKQVIGQAGQALKAEAQSFADAAQQRAREEAQKHTQTATRTLGDFANAIRRAGEELGQSDQSPAARLVRQAADGLEGFSRNLADKQPEDLLNDVRDFGRRNPAAFIGGAVLVGVALGRFLRASDGGGTYGGQSLGGGMGGDAYPIAETSSFAGGESLGDEAMGLNETDTGAPDLTAAQGPGGVEASFGGGETTFGDDLGSLEPSDVTDSTDSTQTTRGS